MGDRGRVDPLQRGQNVPPQVVPGITGVAVAAVLHMKKAVGGEVLLNLPARHLLPRHTNHHLRVKRFGRRLWPTHGANPAILRRNHRFGGNLRCQIMRQRHTISRHPQ